MGWGGWKEWDEGGGGEKRGRGQGDECCIDSTPTTASAADSNHTSTSMVRLCLIHWQHCHTRYHNTTRNMDCDVYLASKHTMGEFESAKNQLHYKFGTENRVCYVRIYI